MKVIFLDINGVLASTRSNIAYGGEPMPEDSTTWNRFDRCAVDLLRAAIGATGAVVVLSSNWRHTVNIPTLEYALGVRIVDVTRPGISPEEARGEQIQEWLNAHPEVSHYAILDDEENMLSNQMDRLCRTSKRNGFLLGHYDELMELLGA